MCWEELYPIVKTQAHFSVMRYEEPERRKDKIQELVCQSYEKYTRDVAAGKQITRQNYKCFVTQRAKEVDKRSICTRGFGGTSITDALSLYRRRPDVETEIVSFEDWMLHKPRKKSEVEEQLSFQIDFKDWQKTLDKIQRKVLNYLIEGFSVKIISEMLKIWFTDYEEREG